MAGYVPVHNLPSLVANNKEAVQQLERDCRDSEEIHGGNRVAMIANKGLPALGKFWISGRTAHPAGDRALRYVEAEHEEFAVDASGGVCAAISDRRTVAYSEKLPSSNTSRNSPPSGPSPWMECGMPGGKYQRSPFCVSRTKL